MESGAVFGDGVEMGERQVVPTGVGPKWKVRVIDLEAVHSLAGGHREVVEGG